MEDNGDGAAGATVKERSAAPPAPTDLQARRQRPFGSPRPSMSRSRRSSSLSLWSSSST